MILLILATGFLGFVMVERHRLQNPGPTSYEATLYSLHVRAVDASNGEPLDFDLEWPWDEISPFGKGSGPTIVEERPDGSKSLDAVGVHWPEGMEVRIRANGYEHGVIRVKGRRSGTGYRRPEKVLNVKLERVPEAEKP